MSNPIGEIGNAPAPASGHAGNGSVAAAGSGNSVSSGFSRENSVSQTEADRSAMSQYSVSLDVPTNRSLGSGDYLEKAIKARIDSFRAIVAYNKAMATEELDLSDTQNLLMSFRGMINDLRVLNNATTIELRSSERLGRIDQALGIDRLKDEINATQREIIGKRAILGIVSESEKSKLEKEIQTLEGENESRRVRISAKEASLAFNSSDDSVVRALSVAPVKTDSKESIKSGEEQLDELKRELQSLEKRFASDEVRARLASLFRAELDSNLVEQSDHYSEAIQPQGFAAALKVILNPRLVGNLFGLLSVHNKSGLPPESPAHATDDTDLAADIRHTSASGDKNLVADIHHAAASGDKNLAADIRHTSASGDKNPVADIHHAAASGDTNLAADIYHAPTAPSETNLAADNRHTLAPDDVAEGVAVILFAEPSVTGSEENPVDQPYLGDSLSLEGANNPRAFALLLAMERIADFQEAMGKNADGVVIDSAGTHQLAQLLKVDQEIDNRVFEAMKDQEQSEAIIRQANKA